jgi:pyruvate formate lyase activating enzyme
MKIAGLQKNSFVDYPGKIAAVVFTPGCNMNCFYCHNQVLLGENTDKNLLDTKEVLEFLSDRRRFLEGLVISGGEPTLQDGLEEFIQDVKRMGYCVKLDTNGTNPRMLKKLIEGKLLDYVAMDIKAPPYKYDQICRVYVNMEKIRESMDLLMWGKVCYEFRTTFVPQLNEEDILCIAGRIKGARLYVLQQFRRQTVHDGKADMRLSIHPHSSDFIKGVAEKIRDMVEKCEIRGCV